MNRAARIVAAAGSGQILVSADVWHSSGTQVRHAWACQTHTYTHAQTVTHTHTRASWGPQTHAYTSVFSLVAQDFP
jgi:hypothetical protein